MMESPGARTGAFFYFTYVTKSALHLFKRASEVSHSFGKGRRVTEGSPDIADFQLALDAMRDGVALWSKDGRLLVANTAASTLMNIPAGVVRPGVERLEVMTFLAKRGDYGPSGDPAALARKLSAGFGQGEVTSLTRKLPDGRYVRADGRRLSDGRSLVTYREVEGPAEMNT
jgi:PAS domain-containing protein